MYEAVTTDRKISGAGRGQFGDRISQGRRGFPLEYCGEFDTENRAKVHTMFGGAAASCCYHMMADSAESFADHTAFIYVAGFP
jgi:hypothetical protein